MTGALISIALQVIVAVGLCLAVYALFGRKSGGFRAYVGLTAAPILVLALAVGLGGISTFAVVAIPGLRDAAVSSTSVVGQLTKNGLNPGAVTLLVLSALFKTSFAEELLFRGLIGKRMIKWVGFLAGNTVQAALFGAVHMLLLVIPDISHATVIGAVAFAAGLGWVNGWINEKWGGGSILPGWCVHGAGNLVTYLCLAYGLL